MRRVLISLVGRMARAGASKHVRLALAMLMIVFVVSAWALSDGGSLSIDALSSWMQRHPLAAPLVFIAAHIIVAAAFLPCSPFTLLAGFLWPLPYSLFLSVVAALCASCTTFLLGRYFWSGALRTELKSAPLQRLLTLSDKHGWRIVAFTHINPALPSSTLGYAFGLSRISFHLYAWSAFLGMLPLQVALVGMGGTARDILLSRVWIAAGISLALATAAFGVWLVLKRESEKIDVTRREEQ